MTRVAVFGTGSWGTAFAAVLADAGNDVVMWGRRAEVVAQINAGTNEDYLPGMPLPPRVRATTEPLAAIEGATIVVIAIPSQTLHKAHGGGPVHTRPADFAVMAPPGGAAGKPVDRPN